MTRSDDTYPEAQDAHGGSSAANDIPGRTWHVTPDLLTGGDSRRRVPKRESCLVDDIRLVRC